MSPDQIKSEVRYDAQGRTIGLDQTDTSPATALKLSLDLGYDAQTGQLVTVDYPEVPTQAARLRAAYAYNPYGYLKTVTDATPGSTGTVWQQITERNADLALVAAVRGLEAGVGGGAIDDHRDYDPVMGRLWTIEARHAGANRLNVAYNYDADGLVQERTTTDERLALDETFGHDALHRLTTTTRQGLPIAMDVPFSTSVEESYDSVGNRIDTKRNGQLVEHRGYGSNGQQPYTLTERDLSDPQNPNAPPTVQTYQYDALGRLKQDPHRTFAWTAFDLPSSVTEDGQTSTFRYDAAHARVQKTSPAETVTTFAGLYERHASANPTRHVFHIVGADEAVADVTYTEPATSSQPGTTAVVYPLTDALGSTNAVADNHGTVAEHDDYDAWGQRSTPDGLPIPQPLLFQSLVSAGFTSQPHDDDLALINLQGRLYDPALGRFLSADPIVGNTAFSQSWNAYSYVNNSPLDFTDPSGFACTASQAVTNASEKAYIASGTCNGGNNYSTSSGEELTVSDGSRVPDAAASNAGAIVVNGIAFMQDQASRAANEEQLHRARTAAASSVPAKTADGTPVVYPLHYNADNAIVDATGRRLHAPINANPTLNYTRHPLAKAIGNFETRLFCGSKCAPASAPTSQRDAASAPKQLSDARLLRNALSQALAARSLVKFLGKVGIIIDEGVDGVIDRLTPDGTGMSEEDERLVAEYLAKLKAQRASNIAEATLNHFNKEAALSAAIARRNKLRAQYFAAEDDLNSLDPTDVGFDLFEKVALDANSEYEKAEAEVRTKEFGAQAAFDYYKALMDEARKWGDFDDR
jgi:RHS repeat-associated protein